MSITIRRFPKLLSAIPLIILALISCSPAPETLHHVVFDANGGSWAQGTEISLDVPDNAPIWNARPSVPERSGYSFRGWFSDKAATKPYDPDSLVTSDTVLYAGWTADRVFRIKRGSSTLYDFSSSVRNDMTLYAVWKAAKEVAFAYDLPASLGKEAELSPCPQPEAVPEGSTISRPEATLSYNGTQFGFLGWFKEGSTEPFDFSSGIAGINRHLEMKACYSTGITEGSNAAGAIAGLNEMKATLTACYWQGGSGLPGIGRLMQPGTIDVHEVAGDTTWESAMAAMNAALSGSGYGYELNTGNDAQPLIPVRR